MKLLSRRAVAPVDTRAAIDPGITHCRPVAAGRRVALSVDGAEVTVHPLWLRERSVEPGDVDATNRQRLVEPADVPLGLRVTAVGLRGAELVVDFDDGRRAVLAAERLLVDLGLRPDPEARPTPEPWHRAGDIDPPTLDWTQIHDPDAVVELLDGYFRLGFFVLHGTPTEPGSLHDIAARFGRINPTNFGVLFDVRSVPEPVDLAYTAVGLSAHTDQPYRRPTPCLQFLHALVNDAPGGDSTVVDGLAAIADLAVTDPEAFRLLSTVDIEFRYDIGSDVVIGGAPMIELGRDGGLRRLRFSPRIDFAPPLDPDELDVYYRGRRRLADRLNDPAHRLDVRLAAGDVLVVDNARVLHGRTPFDPTVGDRHLQGCYIDHDGPESLWRLALRTRGGRVAR